MTATFDPNNVLAGIATLWAAPYDPTTGPEPMPADTIAEGEDWAGNWIAGGATEQGLSFSVNPKTQDTTIEEQIPPVLVSLLSADVTFDTTFAEDTLTTMKLAYGGGTLTVVAAGATQVGKTTLTLSNSLDYLSVGFEGLNPEGFWRRVYIPKVVSVAQVKTSYRRAAGPRLYPATMRAICALTDIVIVNKTAEATA